MSKINDAYDLLGEVDGLVDLCAYATAELSKEHGCAFGHAMNVITAKLDRAMELLREHVAEEKARETAA